MAAELRQLLAQAVVKTEETVRNTDLSQIFSLDTDTLQAAFALEGYRINEENAAARKEPSLNVFDAALVRAVTTHPVPPEQYDLSHQISQGFNLFREHIGDDHEVVLIVCEQGSNGYVMIDAGGNLVVTDHGSTTARYEPLKPEEILFFGQKIANIIEPENLQRLQSLVEQTRNFQWQPYLHSE